MDSNARWDHPVVVGNVVLVDHFDVVDRDGRDVLLYHPGQDWRRDGNHVVLVDRLERLTQDQQVLRVVTVLDVPEQQLVGVLVVHIDDKPGDVLDTFLLQRLQVRHEPECRPLAQLLAVDVAVKEYLDEQLPVLDQPVPLPGLHLQDLYAPLPVNDVAEHHVSELDLHPVEHLLPVVGL